MNFLEVLGSTEPSTIFSAHDALTARLIESQGMTAYCVDAQAIAASQIALPNLGLQRLGEFFEAVSRIRVGSCLPFLVDCENAFGDDKVLPHMMRGLSLVEAAAVSLNDLEHGSTLYAKSRVSGLSEMQGKLYNLLKMRAGSALSVIARTEIARFSSLDDVAKRLRAYLEVGVDALIVPVLNSRQAYEYIRDSVDGTLIASVEPCEASSGPTPGELSDYGYEATFYPSYLLRAYAHSVRQGLRGARNSSSADPPHLIGAAELASILGLPSWL